MIMEKLLAKEYEPNGRIPKLKCATTSKNITASPHNYISRLQLLERGN